MENGVNREISEIREHRKLSNGLPKSVSSAAVQQDWAKLWKEADVGRFGEGDPVKAALAARLRRETTMSLNWICQRFRMGAWSSLHQWLYESRKTL
jgi:hypothetical protein